MRDHFPTHQQTVIITSRAYPSQSVKISIQSYTLSRNLPIRCLMPFQYIPFILIRLFLLSILKQIFWYTITI